MWFVIGILVVIASALTLAALFMDLDRFGPPIWLSRFIHLIDSTPNPLLQMLYLSLVCGIFYVFIQSGFPMVSEFHHNGTWIAVLTTLALFLWASSDQPVLVTQRNQDKLCTVYQADGVLFPDDFQSRKCSTCSVMRIPRSKHCSVCNHCVHGFDHHCIWLNICISVSNKRSFLLFLLATALLCGYCVWLCVGIMWRVAQSGKLIPAPVSLLAFIPFFITKGGVFFALAFITLICGVAVFAFFSFHLYLAARNITTNEYVKRRRYLSAELHENQRRLLRDDIYDRGILRNLWSVFFYTNPA